MVYLMEAADDISYIAADTEDALKKKYVSPGDFLRHASQCKLASEGDLEKLLISCVKSESYSGVKKMLIQSMIKKMKIVVKRFVDEYLKDIETIDYYKSLPLNLSKYCIQNWKKEGELICEFGNLLYLEDDPLREQFNVYSYKKEFVSGRIVNIKEVSEGDAEGRLILENLVKKYIPCLNDKSGKALDVEDLQSLSYKAEIISRFISSAKRVSGYMSHEYQSSIWQECEKLNETNYEERVSKIQNYCLDYIASMTDPFAKEMSKSIYSNAAA